MFVHANGHQLPTQILHEIVGNLSSRSLCQNARGSTPHNKIAWSGNGPGCFLNPQPHVPHGLYGENPQRPLGGPA
eukprot:1864502-Pyramimonas_sp.AAC.1